MANILDKLNPDQMNAVKTVEGPVMVFAGAGTGKTRTLTARIVYMVNNCHINPHNILAITFTNKATREMKERVVSEMGISLGNEVNISTIHALCARILRRNFSHLGYEKSFEIIDEEEMQKILSELFKDNKIDRKVFSPKTASKIISNYKNGMSSLYGLIGDVYEKYQNYMKENNLVDFDDLLLLTKQLFTEVPEVLSYYQMLFQYILVDEFQDTNIIQYDIIKLIAKKNQNIFVVGDDDQSIYSFRGACLENMFSFRKDYPDSKIFKLTTNYRSCNAILKGANSIISHNTIREPKQLHSDIPDAPHSVTVKEAYYYEDEIRYVSSEIIDLVQHEGYEYRDIAILYRNSALSRGFELELISEHIPYNMYGGSSYLKRREIKDALSYLRFIVDPDKINHFRRIVNEPSRGIGDKTIAKVLECMQEEHITLFEAIDLINQTSPSTKNQALLSFKDMIVSLEEVIETMSLDEFFDLVVEKTGYLTSLKTEDDEEQNRVNNLKEFKSILVSIDEFYGDELTQADKIRYGLDEIILEQEQTEDKDPNGIILSTIHSVKGLEFKVVFLVALEESIFPSGRDDIDIEEERRVAYVACTRAKERIYLTCSTSRLIYGRVVRNPKSRFLVEYLVVHEPALAKKLNEPVEQNREIKVGAKVMHTFFGPGLVIAMDDKYVQVLFEKDNTIRKIAKGHPTLK